MTDAAIVRRVLDGDVEAFALLIDRYYDRYARYSEHMLGSRADAEDVVQDAFLRAYRFLPNYEDRERFDAWLFRIVVNQCRSAATRRHRRAVSLEDVDAVAHTAVDDHAAERTALRQDLERAVARLDAEQREAFLLKHVEELSYEEMAAITGVGVSALKMRVKRACERLRSMLMELPNVC